MTYPNILFLTIDALRADRMGFLGYNKNTTPVLDSLTKNAIWCKNAFSLVGTTQPSFPTIFTSTRPLDYGGYDQGILNRPNSLPEVLQSAGYKTIHLASFAWMRGTYGYNRGVDHIEHLYSVRSIVGAALNTIKSTISEYLEKKIYFDEMIQVVGPIIRKCLVDLIYYCDERNNQSEMERKYFKYSLFVNERYNFSKVREVVEDHLGLFDKSPSDYIRKHILRLTKFSADVWISSKINYKRNVTKLFELIWDLPFRVAYKLTKGKIFLYNKYKYKSQVDGGELSDRIIAILKDYDNKRPFYLWTHYIDTHFPYMAGHLPNWNKKNSNYVKSVGYDKKINPALAVINEPETKEEIQAWKIFYDASIRYVDEQIGRIVKTLKDTNLWRNTLLVISGDHGEEIGEHGDFSHRFRLYNESLHIPIIFHHSDFKEKPIDFFVDLRDIAPTILNIAGIKIPKTYNGEPINKIKGGKRDHLIAECFYRGNCLFKYRPLYLGVRTKQYKYIWREWIDPLDKKSNDQYELYDLRYDKEEKENIYESKKPEVKKMNKIIANRLAQIPEYVKNRSELKLKDLGIKIKNKKP